MATAGQLIVCREVKGGATVDPSPLVCERMRDALLAPLGSGSASGLFDGDGRLHRSAAYFRGLPQPHFPLETETTTLSPAQTPLAPTGFAYFFAGHFTAHYGHFFFAMLSRLWALPQPVPANLRLVLLGSGDVEEPFRHAFSRTILQTLGLTPDHFASFAAPVRFEEIAVPRPGLEENHAGHIAFADFCHDLGRRISHDRRAPASTRPVFLTKREMTAGVHTILNEDVVCSVLGARGVEIVSPERLPLGEQIALWTERPVVAGMFGSMLHTSLFAPGRRYVALNPERWINSNQVIIDQVNRNTATILYPDEDYLNEGADSEFGLRLRLKAPKAAARQIWRQMEADAEGQRPPGLWERLRGSLAARRRGRPST